jgi:hypothetical protein
LVVRRRGGSRAGFDDAPGRVPVPKLSRGNSNLGRARSRRPPGKVALTFGYLSILLCFGGAVAGFVAVTTELPYRAGWAGTPGTVSLITCETVSSGRSSHTDCDGEFRTGPSAEFTAVSVEGDSTYSISRVYPARLHSDGQTVSVVGAKSVAFILGGMFAVLGFVDLFCWSPVVSVAGWVFRRRRQGMPWRPARWAMRGPLIAFPVLVGLGIVFGIVGAVLNF